MPFIINDNACFFGPQATMILKQLTGNVRMLLVHPAEEVERRERGEDAPQEVAKAEDAAPAQDENKKEEKKDDKGN